MGLFDFFRRTPSGGSTQGATVPLEQSTYDIAYFILPHYIFESLDRIIDLCTTTPSVAGPFFYTMSCQRRGFEPNMEYVRQYTWHTGELDGRKYLALEYPFPRSVDVFDSDPITLMQPGTALVLAPYFSLILYDSDSPPRYYILGQSPIRGRTTLRTITADGMNCNLGPGPEPKLNLFMEAIRERFLGVAE